MRLGSLPALILGATLATGAATAAERPAATIADLARLVGSTCRDPRLEALGVQVTLRFSLRADGTLVGPPSVTAVAAPQGATQDIDVLKREVDAVMRTCTPLPITAALGRAIAGRIFIHRVGRPTGRNARGPALDI